MYKSDIFTVSADLAGISSITLSAGHNANGFPIGMQFQTSHQLESQLLNFSN
jgi:Asp-tRNA(Asn)/Glu-tRNA(Gln) amidotransferase A subunit family amidase